MNHPFGSNFGSSGSHFGSSTTMSGFGMSGIFSASSGSGFGASTSPLFGSTTPGSLQGGGVFGGNTNPALFSSFNNQTPAQNTFGQSPTTSTFGQTPSQPTFGQSTGFGNPSSSVPRFGGFGGTSLGSDASQGTYGVPFEKVLEPDSSQSTRESSGRSYLMNISAMHRFVNESPETLRAIDYKKGHKRQSGIAQNTFGSGNQSPSLFSGTGTGFGMTGASTGGMFGSGFGAQNPSGGLFGQSSTGRFGFGAATGSAFGSNTTGSPFGANTGTALFTSNTPPAFGASTQPSTPLFAASTGTLLFGQTSTGFGTGFGQSGASRGGLFGNQPSTGASIFGANTTPAFGSNTGGSLFSNTTGGSFSFGATTGGFFQNPNTGGSIFGPAANTGTGLFGTPNSTSPFNTGSNMFRTQTSPSFLGSNPGANQGQGMSLFQQPQGAFQTPNAPSAAPNLGAFGPSQDPSTHPNWTPAYGIVAPSLAKQEELLDGQAKLENIDRFDYMKGNKVVSLPYPVKFVLEEKTSTERDAERAKSEWSWATVSKPPEPSMEEKLEKWIQNLKKDKQSSVPADTSVAQSSMTQTNVNRSETQENKERLIQDEEIRRQMGAFSSLTNEEIEALLPVVTDPEYYILPNAEALMSMVANRGKEALKRVHGVEIGRRGYGKVIFTDPLDLEGININEHLTIRRGMITITDGSPFKRVNGVCTLFKVYLKIAGRVSTDDDSRLAAMRETAKHVCEARGYTFISFDKDHTWAFKLL